MPKSKSKLRSLLAGDDGPGRRALPVGEFLHLVPLSALLLLVLNDWWLKPSTWAPSLLTGKLSDVAGLLLFPLLLTTVTDCLLLALHRFGLRVDFSLRRYKIHVATAATALCFALVKTHPACNALAVDTLRSLGLSAHISLDPSDLLALPALAISLWLARAELARVPLGRLEYIESRFRHHSRVDMGSLLSDAVRAGANAQTVATLAENYGVWLATGDGHAARMAERCLEKLRNGG